MHPERTACPTDRPKVLSATPRHPPRRLLLRLLALLGPTLAPPCFAAQGSVDRVVRSWGEGHGLPLGGVSDLLVGPTGHLWIATFSGLARFDGRDFVHHQIADHPALGSNRLLCLLDDGRGRIWIGTEGQGLTCLEAEGHRFRVPEGPDLGGVTVLDLARDGSGTVWAATTAGLLRVPDGEPARVEAVREEGAPAAASALALGPHGELLAAGPGGLHGRLDGTWRALPGAPSDTGHVLSLASTSRGLWIGSERGLFVLEGERARRIEAEALTGDHVQAVLEDPRGDLWFALAHRPPVVWPSGAAEPEQARAWRRGGEPAAPATLEPVRALTVGVDGALWAGGTALQRVRASAARTTLPLPGPDPQAWMAVPDGAGGIWLAPTREGLLRHTPGEGFREYFATGPERLPQRVYGLFRDRSGTLWIGLERGLVRMPADGSRPWREDERLAGLELRGVRAFHEDAQGTLWVGDELGVVRLGREALRLDGSDGLAPGSVHCIADDADGRVWVGSDGGLSEIGPDGVRSLTAAEEPGLPPGGIRALLVDREGVLWIGSYGGGLGRLDGRGPARFTLRGHGLPENTVSGLFELDGRLWFYGNRGVHSLSREELLEDPARVHGLHALSFGPDDGIDEGNGGFCPAGFVGPLGHLWIPTRRGLVELDPRAEPHVSTTPRAWIEGLEVDGRRVEAGAERIGPGAVDVTIVFSVLALSDPDGVDLRYRLEGHDEHWVPAGRAREAHYPQLAPGSYTFRLSVRGPDGTWLAEERCPTLALRLDPVLWARPAFLVPVLTSSLLALAVGLTRRGRRRREEAERREQARRMEALGALAGGIAHDLNNVLTPVLGYTELARERLPAMAPERAMLDNVLRAAERARRLVEGMLNFGRRRPRLASVPLREVVEETAALVRPELGGVELSVAVDPRVGPVLGDATQLHQVVHNLVRNALQALEGRGRIEVELGEVHLGPERLEGLGRVKPGRYACLMVRDDGPGMPAAVLQRVFEPFFTTKEPGRGTGMGLAVVHGIVLAHDGHVAVTSREGEGTTFRVYLPLAPAAGPEAADGRPLRRGERRLRPGRASSVHVLVVDDEELVLELVREALAARGHRVSCFSRPSAALEALEDSLPPFSLAILDQNLPGTSGLELAQRLHERRPDLPVLLMTGMPRSLGPRERLSPHLWHILYKPFDEAELLEAVELVLARAAEGERDGARSDGPPWAREEGPRTAPPA